MPEDKQVQEPIQNDSNSINVGDWVTYTVTWDGGSMVSRGQIVDIEGNAAHINVDGDPLTDDWAPLGDLTKVNAEEPGPLVEEKSEDLAHVQPNDGSDDPVVAAASAKQLVIQAMGYKDLPAQMRACFLLGLAEQKLWKSGVDQIKKKYEKEMKDRVKALTKWGTVRPSDESVKDVIAKVLMENGISAYPNLVEAIYANPFQERAFGPDLADHTMSEPR